jgi:PAS domain-containing protein
MRINLFWRLLITLLFIIGTITCLLKFWLEPFLVEFYSQREMQNITSIAQVSSSMLTSELLNSCSLKSIEELNKKLSEKTRSQVIITIPNCGKSELANFDLNLYHNQPDLFSGLSGQSIAKVKSSNYSQTVTLYSAEPIYTDDTLIGAIQVESTINPFPNEILISLNRIYFAFFLLSLLSLVYSFLFYKHYSNMLRKVSNKIHDLIEIRVGTETKITSLFTNEIEQLEKSINRSVVEIHRKLDSYSSETRVFKSILNNMNDGILVTDQSGQIKLINYAASDMFSVEIPHLEMHSLVEVLRN